MMWKCLWELKRYFRSWGSTSSAAEVDFLNLCISNVRIIDDLARGENLLNKRQCQDLAFKLSDTILNIRKLLSHCEASANLFRPALEDLYRYLEKSKVLLSDCAEEDWCAAAVFQIQNENAFREILLEVSLCYNVIYEQAKSMTEDVSDHVEDLRRQTLAFRFTPNKDILLDQQDLQKRLDDFVKEPGSVLSRFLDGFLSRDMVVLKQELAKYLLAKLKYTSEQSQATSLDACSEILWQKESEPFGTWGNNTLLGVGSGANVYATEWMGIPCAKKIFREFESEFHFLQEAGILAHLNHPCIVKFFCCGTGKERVDRFIAMELMELSLLDVIDGQKSVHFQLPIVLDMMVQMAWGMCYLHARGIAHRDLQPKNVDVNRLTSPHLGGHYCLKLVDFETSRTKVKVSKLNEMEYPGIGTTRYRAPEIHRQAHPDGRGKALWFKADVYSFAMTCAHLLCLRTPFECVNMRELYNQQMQGVRPELPMDCPQELVSLLEACWNTNPALRPAFNEICIQLESFKHEVQRGYHATGLDLPRESMDFSTDFIKLKLEEFSSLHRMLKVNCTRCDALVEEYKAGLGRIFIPQLLEAASSGHHNDISDSLSLFLYSLGEVVRCMRSGTIYTSRCAIDPEVVSIDHSDASYLSKMALFLLRDFFFYLDLAQVGFSRFMFERKILDVSGNPVGWDMDKGIVEEFCKNELFDLFEWCERSCRPVLKQRFAEIGQEVMQHPSVTKEHLRGSTMDPTSPWMQVPKEPNDEPNDLAPVKLDYKDIHEGVRLGQGGFGTVFRCKWHNKDMVVKIMDLDPTFEKLFEKEIRILSSIGRHPNTVQIFGFGYRKVKKEGFILMERMEMDLTKLIEETMHNASPDLSTVFPLEITLDMMFQIVEGMCFLKGKGVIHRDIKPANILVNRPDKGTKPFERFYCLKLADFGTSKINEMNSIFSTMRQGTPSYMAPEVMSPTIIDQETGKQGYSFKADVYSFGMVCSEILTGKRPFQRPSQDDVLFRDIFNEVHAGKRPHLPLDDGDPLRMLIEDCWKLNPEARPNIWQVRQRLWECRAHYSKLKRPPMSWQTFGTHLESRLQEIEECQSEMCDYTFGES